MMASLPSGTLRAPCRLIPLLLILRGLSNCSESSCLDLVCFQYLPESTWVYIYTLSQLWRILESVLVSFVLYCSFPQPGSMQVYITLLQLARRIGSDSSMSASGSAGPGFDPWWGSKFSFHFQLCG